MSFVKHALLLSLLGSAYAQSSASASAAASAAGSGAAAGGSQQALTATTQVANSINSALPQSASAGPNGFTIP